MSDDTTALAPAAKFRSLVERLAVEATATFPLSVSREDLARSWDRLIGAVKASAMRDVSIYECSPASIARAIVLCALTDLYPDGVRPDVYLIPRRNKGTLELNWQPSFRALVKVARRAGVHVQTVPVFAGDDFTYEAGLRPRLHHVPKLDAPRTWETLRAVYCIVREKGAPTLVEVMPASEIGKRRAVSDSWRKGYGPWKDWPIEMSMKTALIYTISRHVSLGDARLAAALEPGDEVLNEPEEEPARRDAIDVGPDALDRLLADTGIGDVVPEREREMVREREPGEEG